MRGLARLFPLRGIRAKFLARVRGDAAVYSWPQFARQVRTRSEPLLARLADFPDCILVSGCQRSGTTVLTRVIAGSDEFESFRLTHDDELDAAQILAGLVPFKATRRVCFQTTYINERYPEYWTVGGAFRLVWVLREPRGVVNSMIGNWSRFALDELFMSCGLQEATTAEQLAVQRDGAGTIPLVRKACLAYIGKVKQLSELQQRIPAGRLAVVDYLDLVARPESTLMSLFSFLDVPYRSNAAKLLRTDSLAKADGLDRDVRRAVDQQCHPVYASAMDASRMLRSGDGND